MANAFFSPLVRIKFAILEVEQNIRRYCHCSLSFCTVESKFNPLRPNNDLSQTSHCNIKGLSVSEVTRI